MVGVAHGTWFCLCNPVYTTAVDTHTSYSCCEVWKPRMNVTTLTLGSASLLLKVVMIQWLLEITGSFLPVTIFIRCQSFYIVDLNRTRLTFMLQKCISERLLFKCGLYHKKMDCELHLSVWLHKPSQSTPVNLRSLTKLWLQ